MGSVYRARDLHFFAHPERSRPAPITAVADQPVPERYARDFAAVQEELLRVVVVLALPCAEALLAIAQPLVAVLFHYGAFKDSDVARTAWAVMGWGDLRR